MCQTAERLGRTFDLVARKALGGIISPATTRLVWKTIFGLMGRRYSKCHSLGEVKHVLVIRPDEIGDVVMITPFLRELRHNVPNAWITLIVNPQVLNLVDTCPYVNEILTCQRPRYGLPITPSLYLRALILAARSLWHRHFDLVILLRWDVDYYNSSFLAYFSGAPWRVAYSETVSVLKQKLNCQFDLLFTDVLKTDALKHEVERNLDILSFLGGEVKENRLELWLNDEDEKKANEILTSQGGNHGTVLVAIHAGAGTAKRKWAVELYAQLVNWICVQYQAAIVYVGGNEDALVSRQVASIAGGIAIHAAGIASLRVTTAILKRCCLLIGNDSGPIHMAAAMNIPVVVISCHSYASAPDNANSPIRFKPWSSRHVVLQPAKPVPPCKQECTAQTAHCILGVTIEQVKAAVAREMPR